MDAAHLAGRWIRRLVQAVGLVLMLLVAYLAFTAAQVWWHSQRDVTQPADVAVVLGAAQYDGRPSPVLRARLDHAAQLYERGLAPAVWVTGYNRPGDRFTEAGVAATYLGQEGVPGGDIERITVGATTSYTTLLATARELKERGIDEAVLVSDPLHALRIAQIAADLGLQVETSPARSLPASGLTSLRQLGRETVAVALGRVLGYDRVDRLGLYLDRAGVGRL
ncbi:MAG: YdcF family protein [Egibacteraceae bacterium]